MVKLRELATKAFRALRSQWLATVLIVPLALLGLQAWMASNQARDARIQAERSVSIDDMQRSGKALDAALAVYLTALAELGVSEQGLPLPNQVTATPLRVAEAEVTASRRRLDEAIIQHASDVQALRGTIDNADTSSYMNALVEVRKLADEPPDIGRTGANITAFSNLIVERNSLVDQARG